MSRKKIRDIRHQEFIEASIQSIHKIGYATVTMADIAKEADSTAASINYYFGSKENLMGATMRYLMGLLRVASISRLSACTDHQSRILAIIDANFDHKLYTNANCSVWVQFWSHAPYSEQLARLHRINRSRVSSHVKAELKHLVPTERVDITARTLQAYMDGAWIWASQSNLDLDPIKAQKEAHQMLELIVPR